MKILETTFFYLTIIIPSLVLLIMILNFKKAIKKPKYRMRLFKIFLVSLLFNGALFGGVKMINNKNLNSSNNYEDNNNPDNKIPNQNQNNEDENRSPIEEEPTQDNKTSKGFTIENKNGVTYIDGYMIANKTYPLPEDYVPTNTHKKVTDPKGACAECLINEAYDAYIKLKKDATNNGLNLWIASGFRSYSYQAGLYNSYVKNRGGKEKADTFSARPGHSEHQTGYAFDLNSVDSSFANTKEGIWINENCYKYGFIIRYPKDKDNETGYKYEPWHLRYVGLDLATKLYNAGDWITMESYFGITSTYPD